MVVVVMVRGGGGGGGGWWWWRGLGGEEAESTSFLHAFLVLRSKKTSHFPLESTVNGKQEEEEEKEKDKEKKKRKRKNKNSLFSLIQTLPLSQYTK